MRQLSENDDAPFWEYLGNKKDGDRAISTSVAHSFKNVGGVGTTVVGSKNVEVDSTDTPANGDCVLIHQTMKSGGITTENWELNVLQSGAGTVNLVMKYGLQNAYVDDNGDNQFQIVELKEYGDVTFSGGGNLQATEWDGNIGGILAFLVNGSLSGSGAIVLNGRGFRGGNLRGGDGGPFSGAGEGDAGARNKQQQANNGNGGGAGNHLPGHRSGGAGGGGNGTSGAAGGDPLAGSTPSLKGYGGTAGSGSADLVSALFGGGGGHQGTATDPGGLQGGDLGDGGGLCMIFGKDLDFSSITFASTGTDGLQDDDQNGFAAGAGGSCLLVGETINLGTNKFNVNGGAQGGPGFDAPLNGAGGLGRLYARYKSSLSGSNASPAFGSAEDQLLLPYDTSDIF